MWAMPKTGTGRQDRGYTRRATPLRRSAKTCGAVTHPSASRRQGNTTTSRERRVVALFRAGAETRAAPPPSQAAPLRFHRDWNGRAEKRAPSGLFPRSWACPPKDPCNSRGRAAYNTALGGFARSPQQAVRVSSFTETACGQQLGQFIALAWFAHGRGRDGCALRVGPDPRAGGSHRAGARHRGRFRLGAGGTDGRCKLSRSAPA